MFAGPISRFRVVQDTDEYSICTCPGWVVVVVVLQVHGEFAVKAHIASLTYLVVVVGPAQPEPQMRKWY